MNNYEGMAQKISDSVYFVGIFNPNVRLTDVIVKTDFGTSYNSYIIKTGGKNILVETCRSNFFDSYISNIKKVCDPSQIGYIIINHSEPDHSGCLANLLEINPDIKVICSNAAQIYLKNITNRSDINFITVKDNEQLDLDGVKLKFISAPFLHWPDSIFTFMESEKILFTCDFLGAHYCEPYVFDFCSDKKDAYDTCLKNYFDAIFGPFKNYVLDGLRKISSLDFDFVCPSHGPVLTKDNNFSKLELAIASYKDWAEPKKNTKAVIPIFYCTAYGNTLKLALAIRDGILSQIADADVQLFNLVQEDINYLCDIMNSSDAFLIGSPTINRDAVPHVWHLLSGVDAVNCRNKNVGIFGSFGWSGEAVKFIEQRLQALKMKVFADGFRINFVPSDDDLQRAKEFGADFAKGICKSVDA